MPVTDDVISLIRGNEKSLRDEKCPQWPWAPRKRDPEASARKQGTMPASTHGGGVPRAREKPGFRSLTCCASLGSVSPLWISAGGGRWQHLPHRAVDRIQQAVLTALLPVPRMAEGKDAHRTPRALTAGRKQHTGCTATTTCSLVCDFLSACSVPGTVPGTRRMMASETSKFLSQKGCHPSVGGR